MDGLIPKKLHVIWLGNKYKRPAAWIATWKDMNPSWEFKEWNEADLAKAEWELKRHLDKFLKKRKYDVISDLMRYEILHRYGGVYVDADSVCLRPLDDDLRRPAFWAAYESENARKNGLIQNAFIGAVPGHPVLGSIIKEIGSRRNALKVWTLTGRKVLGPCEATGPAVLTRAIRKYGTDNVTILPSHYFFPRDIAGNLYSGDDEPYADHFYGSALGAYEVMRWSREIARQAAPV